MKKKVSECIMLVLCAAQVVAISGTFKVGDSLWKLLLFVPPFFVGWYLDTFCNIFNLKKEEEE